jgi:hypothetical protein
MKSFYDLTKQERMNIAATISNEFFTVLHTSQQKKLIDYFGDNVLVILPDHKPF